MPCLFEHLGLDVARAKLGPDHVVERLEVDDVFRRILDRARIERALAPVVALHLFGHDDAELAREDRREPRRRVAEHARRNRRVVNAGEIDPHLGEHPRVEADIVDDLHDPLVAEDAGQRRDVGRDRVDDRDDVAARELRGAHARAVRVHSVVFEIDADAFDAAERAGELTHVCRGLLGLHVHARELSSASGDTGG